ncbi:MAG: glycosyltransferase family 2 protein [Bacteroidetes bacterium]|nr:glycosyltransferase family 2 protein [Bacteroidota bacterium]
MATYNGARFLREQVESLLAQTYQAIEIVAVDDCSSDETVAILKEYATKYSNFKVEVNEQNLGPTKTIERGISLSKGKFITLCDQDDIWDADKIAITLKEMKEGVTLAYCDSLFIDEAGKSLNRKISDLKNMASFDSAMPFLIGNCVAGHAAIFEKDFAMKAMPFPENIIHDWWLAYVATLQGRLAFVDKALVLYRQHSNNVIGAIRVKGRAKKKEIDQNLIVRNRIKLFLEKCPESNKEVKDVLANLQKSYSSFSLTNNFARMFAFFKHQAGLLALKKRSPLRKWMFCIKMFFKII